MHTKTGRCGENRIARCSTRLALCLGIAALLLSAAPDSRADSPHIYGFHSWSRGCDVDVMSGKTGWFVWYQDIYSGLDSTWLVKAKSEGFTIIMGLFADWDEEIPPDRDDWPAFIARCAELADQTRDYCRIFHIDNEMDFNEEEPSRFTECFRMVRDAIRAVNPDALVTNGGTVGTPTYFPELARRLGAEIDGYQNHIIIYPHYLEALAGIPGAARRPYYITEFTTVPYDQPGWFQSYYADINAWNQTEEQNCACACWFVYDLGGWSEQSLKYLPLANADYEDTTANSNYTNRYGERPISVYDVQIDITSTATGTVSWKTDIAATTQIEWYSETDWKGRMSAFDPTLSTDHTADFFSCAPDTLYNLFVRATAYDYGDDAEHFTFGTNTSTSPGGWLRAGWNLMSLPLEPADPRATVVFDTAIAAGNDITNNLFAYDGAYSIYPSGFTTLQKGKAYWLRLDTASDEYCEGLHVTSGVEIDLSHGWNLIGQPHDYPTPLADCEVSDGATTLNFGDAVSAGWIEEPLYFYGAVGYETCIRSGGDDDQLRPWYGYWALTNADGLTLIIP